MTASLRTRPSPKTAGSEDEGATGGRGAGPARGAGARPAAPTPFTALEWTAVTLTVIIWGVNNAAVKMATAEIGPLTYGAARFVIAAIALAAFVRPPFPHWRRLLLMVVACGPIHFGLVNWAFAVARDLSPISVALQLWIPMAALFAWRILGERINRGVVAGVGVAFAGVVVMTFDAHAFQDWRAILIAAGASAAWALGTVLVRAMPGISPLKVQGCLCVVSAVSFLFAAYIFEPHPVVTVMKASLGAQGAVLWSALASSVVGSGLTFWMMQRREAGQVTPYYLATPLVSILIGVLFMGDVMTAQIALGAAATIAGVGVVAAAENRRRRFSRAAAFAELGSD